MSSNADSTASFSVSNTTETSRSSCEKQYVATSRPVISGTSPGSGTQNDSLDSNGSWVITHTEPAYAIQSTSPTMRRSSSQPTASTYGPNAGRRCPSLPRGALTNVASASGTSPGQADSTHVGASGTSPGQRASRDEHRVEPYARSIPRTPRGESGVAEVQPEWAFLRRYVSEHTNVPDVDMVSRSQTQLARLSQSLNESLQVAVAVQAKAAFHRPASRDEC